MNTLTPIDVPARDDSAERIALLTSVAEQVLEMCKARGATQSEVDCSESSGLTATVRMGEAETVESNRDRGVSLTVYFGQRKGTASTGDLAEESLQATVEQACAIAKYTETDPASGLADAELMARDIRDFDLWHPTHYDADAFVAEAIACEAAGRAFDKRITNSDGCTMAASSAVGVYANSHGFIGTERDTGYTLACALIAGEGEAMQREGWYTTAIRRDALESAQSVGERAAREAVARLSPRSLPTGAMPVVFSPEMARGLIGAFLGAVSGSALYREASFLLDHAGKPVFPSWVDILETPHVPGGFRSTSFDAEGVATRESAIVAGGVLQRYLLGSYSARKLGLTSTGNAGGVHNLRVNANAPDLKAILQDTPRCFLVTSLMGQGVNMITGDYSRGAAGFLVENGEIAYAVDGITIAGNLKTMFQEMDAISADFDPRSHLHVGAIRVPSMTVAGNAA